TGAECAAVVAAHIVTRADRRGVVAVRAGTGPDRNTIGPETEIGERARADRNCVLPPTIDVEATTGSGVIADRNGARAERASVGCWLKADSDRIIPLGGGGKTNRGGIIPCGECVGTIGSCVVTCGGRAGAASRRGVRYRALRISRTGGEKTNCGEEGE